MSKDPIPIFQISVEKLHFCPDREIGSSREEPGLRVLLLPRSSFHCAPWNYMRIRSEYTVVTMALFLSVEGCGMQQAALNSMRHLGNLCFLLSPLSLS